MQCIGFNMILISCTRHRDVFYVFYKHYHPYDYHNIRDADKINYSIHG